MKNIFLAVFIISFLASPLLASAAGLVPCGRSSDDISTPYDETEDCTFCHLLIMADNVFDFVLLRIIPLAAILFIAIDGTFFFWISKDPKTVAQARGRLISVFIGLALIYSSWLIVNFFFVNIGLADWLDFNKFFVITCG